MSSQKISNLNLKIFAKRWGLFYIILIQQEPHLLLKVKEKLSQLINSSTDFHTKLVITLLWKVSALIFNIVMFYYNTALFIQTQNLTIIFQYFITKNQDDNHELEMALLMTPQHNKHKQTLLSWYCSVI